MSEGGKLPIALFNGTVATSNGTYHVEDITVEEAKQLIEKYGFLSAIGHEAVAEVMSYLFGVEIEMNRIQFQHQVGQKAIALKLTERPPEGSVLCREEMDKIGYSLKIMTRID
ncbi:Domain of unknown function DUF1874 [Alkaliphilus metalliredigens QYMF]|uniref:DUF1874 domain-containing protein n=1 Tax=Alkaliphilus metalliredigens (strain QYMF) TaxID=293826 RepID=A6TNV4_ALKMQ|nr:YddF family protein [Alkaliphilus metalliredigens]ABR47872.1 Domain of unknown function DUF1874 [Alkaliphilus metalliredigens QYMF]